MKDFADVFDPISAVCTTPETAPIPATVGDVYVFAITLAEAMQFSTANAIGMYIQRLPVEAELVCWSLAVRRDKRLAETAGFIEFSNRNRDTLFR